MTTLARPGRRVVAASMASTVVEWYEFFLYGTAGRHRLCNRSSLPGGTKRSRRHRGRLLRHLTRWASAARPVGLVWLRPLRRQNAACKQLLGLQLLVGWAQPFILLTDAADLSRRSDIGPPALLVVLRFLGSAVGEWGGRSCSWPNTAPTRPVVLVQIGLKRPSPSATRWPPSSLFELTTTLSDTAFLSWGGASPSGCRQWWC